jgi:hypothetical protein
MVGSAVIGGFILAMIEGVGIMINRYNYMFMPQGPAEGRYFSYDSFFVNYLILFLEAPVDLDKGKVDLSVPPFFGSPPGQSSSAPGHFS